MSTVVRTKGELKKARDSGAYEIHVVGELADKLHRAKKVALLSGAALASLVAAVAAASIAAPFSGGLSLAAAGAIATLTGADIVAIIAASAVGIALVVAVFKGYEDIGYSKGSLRLRKRQSAD